MAETMIYRRLADDEPAPKNTHTTSDGRFEYRIVDLSGPDDPIPDGFSRSLTEAPVPKGKPGRKPKAAEVEPEGNAA